MSKGVLNKPAGIGCRPASAGGIPRVRLVDVATKAGVNYATASQVLNDRPNCWASEATRTRIREAAEALGYRPNLAARALQSGRTHVVGLVSPGFLGDLHSRPGGFNDAAAKADYTVSLSSHANDSESEDLVIRRLIDRGVDGLAVYPVDTGPHAELRRLVESGFPVVTFDGANLLDFPCDDVSVDYEAVGRLQADCLLRLGRRRICLANAVPEARINVIRDEAVRRELARAGAPRPIEMRMRRLLMLEMMEAEHWDAPLRAFLTSHRGKIDGVISIDSLASLSVRVLQELGLRVPEDVAVVGGGNSFLASYGAMPLTSISTEDDAAGVTAFGLLMDRIDGRADGPFRRVTSPAKLIVRKSTQGMAN